jgi:hypothetical protein
MKLDIFKAAFLALVVFPTPLIYQVITPSATQAAMTCNFDLTLHEGGDHKGHTIANHVGKSDSFLTQRLTNDPELEGASTYASLQQAQSLTNSAICEDQVKLSNFINNAEDKTRLVLKKKFSSITGTLMKADKTKNNVYSVTVVIQKKSTFKDKLVIITSYPLDL